MYTRYGRKASFSWRTGPNRNKRARAHSCRGVQPGFPGVQAQTRTNGYVHTCQGAYSQASLAYKSKRARTGTCIRVSGRKASFSGRTGPNRHKRARAHSCRGVQPGFSGVQAQMGSNGHVHTQRGRRARFWGLIGPNRHERTRPHTSSGVQPGLPGAQALTGTNGHVNICPRVYSQIFRA